MSELLKANILHHYPHHPLSSCREFVLGLNLSTKPLDEKIRWAFKLYDGDKDGLIQRTEIKQVRRSVAKATLEIADIGN